MSATADRVPKYRHYVPKDLGVVRIDGRDYYLGKYNSPESWEKYHRLLAERYARGGAAVASQQGSKPEAESLAIVEVGVRYYRFAETYYLKGGKPTSQLRLIRLSLKTLNGLYGNELAKDFSPLSLKACRGDFIRQGLSRRECNRRTNLIKQAFAWGTENGLVPALVFHALQSVRGLRAGRSEAPDHPPVGPVLEAIVERTIEHLSPTVAAMVRLQLASAMRPGELVTMRACDLNMAGPIWEYRPGSHKTEHHESRSTRVIMLGPKAVEVILPFLALDISGYLFSPKRVMAEFNAARRDNRQTPLFLSHAPRYVREKKARGRHPAGDKYTVNAYRIAVARACDAAFPHPALGRIPKSKLTGEEMAELKAWQKSHRWHPHQLRHSAATIIRKHYGAEAAQCVLGHAELGTTEIYAEKSLDLARQIMEAIG